MNELDEARKKKVEQLKRLHDQSAHQMQEQQQFQNQVSQLESVVRQVLTREALSRYGNLKTAYPEKAVQVLAILAQAIQSGQISKVDDNLLKEILKKLEPEKRKFTLKK
jgi:DNA-binding TFAR19-related protein (PDSD5 family)